MATTLVRRRSWSQMVGRLIVIVHETHGAGTALTLANARATALV